MTRTEFENRTFGVKVTDYEFDAINTCYLASDLDKDDFCKMWCKMNASRVAEAKARERHEACVEAARSAAWGIVNCGYTYAEYAAPAAAFVTKSEEKKLAYLGIIVNEPDRYGHYKSLSTLCYEINTKVFTR